jgi:hypothetical protein
LSRAELQHLRQPSMAGVMEAVAGYWGTAFISVGVIVSVLGAYLAWTLMSAEVLFVAGLATFYTVFLVFAAGLDFLLLSFIIYAPARSCSSCRGGSRTGVLLPGRAGHLRDRRSRGHCRIAALATGAITI